MTDQSADLSYDEIPYASVPFPQTHPSNLAAVANMFGLEPPPADACRMLEIGCACGDNLVPLAMESPQLRIVGIDRVSRQVEAARALAARFGVANARFECLDLTAMPAELGEFDYIVAHGLYSWVPPQVQESLLAVIRRHLAPNGVAFVSYNILPGWYVKLGVRDLILYHTRNVPALRDKVKHAVGMLRFAAASIPVHLPYPETKLYGAFLTGLVQRLSDTAVGRDSYVAHEYLEEWNRPVYFHQFADHAARHGLQYLAEADVSSMFAQDFPPEVSETLARLGDDRIVREQYLDFLKNRPFRQSLLVHAAARPAATPLPTRMVQLNVASDAKPGEGGAAIDARGITPFKAASGQEFAADEPMTKCAIAILGRCWPKLLPFAELARQAREMAGGGEAALLAEELTPLYAAGCIELRATLPRFAQTASERPRASAWARYRAASGEVVSNLRHGAVRVGPVFRRLIALMDGSRDCAALATALVAAVEAGDLTLEAEEGAPQRSLAELAQAAVAKHVGQAAEFALLED